MDSYHNIIGILSSRCIRATGPVGMARFEAPAATTQMAVSFSEIPVHLLERLARRRMRGGPSSWHGIAFRKDHLISQGGNPILYAYQGSPLEAGMRGLMDRALADDHPADDPVWGITPFVDAPGHYAGKPRFFEWEREWRIASRDFEFSEDDVAFLVMPEVFHEPAVGFFEQAYAEHTGPSYRCPFVDLTWSPVRIGTVLDNIP
ncbi:hypothetical protein [Aureimonas sp. SK2]|uniref:hypothetical protein n=1 Tax=Aureimonas sp. SK2 TaxID=3015992 RepID=UPI002443743B|nr:hypothetical protein [Aureimonas sp. SK2]